MTKFIAIITALCLMLSLSVPAETRCAENSVTIALNANITTGFEWTAFVMGGSSAEIDEAESGYVSDPVEDFACGVGGTHYFKINALKPGDTAIRLTLARSYGEIAEERVLLVTVDDDMNIYTSFVTDEGVLTGIASEINAEEHSALIMTETAGEVIALFPDDALPVNGENIRIYTNGTMTMSLPPYVNVIAWEAVADANQRTSLLQPEQ